MRSSSALKSVVSCTAGLLLSTSSLQAAVVLPINPATSGSSSTTGSWTYGSAGISTYCQENFAVPVPQSSYLQFQLTQDTNWSVSGSVSFTDRLAGTVSFTFAGPSGSIYNFSTSSVTFGHQAFSGSGHVPAGTYTLSTSAHNSGNDSVSIETTIGFPEPAALLLLSVGGLMLHRKRRPVQ